MRRTHLLVRRLRVRPRQPETRAASGPALGVLRPLCEELADGPSDIGTRKRGPELSACRKAFARAAAERRKARRPAIRPVISGDPEIGPTARRTIGCGASAPAPVGALLPLIFRGAEKRTKGIRRPAQTGRRSVGCLTK